MLIAYSLSRLVSKTLCLACIVWLSVASFADAGELWNLEELRKPPKVEWVDTTGPIRKLYYESEPLGGKPTRVFAYCAFPEKIDGKAPAMVLIHGGGGTAFPEWAQLWAERGYVAIAMDLAGKGPDRVDLEDGGPDQSDEIKFPKSNTDLREMWSYHAVAAAIRARALLTSLPEVDSDRIGVTGISWGGYLTCIVAGIEDRFKVAVPVYGCGFLHEDSAWLNRFEVMDAEWKKVWIENFDPGSHVGKAKMPVLFVNGTNDFAYPMGSYQKTYRLVPTRKLCVTVNMPHGHVEGWRPVEIGLFVDQYLKQGDSFPEVKPEVQIDTDAKTLSFTVVEAKNGKGAFHWTHDVGPWQKRNWNSIDVGINNSVGSTPLPEKRPLSGFFTVKDDRGAVVSTEHFELE